MRISFDSAGPLALTMLLEKILKCVSIFLTLAVSIDDSGVETAQKCALSCRLSVNFLRWET